MYYYLVITPFVLVIFSLITFLILSFDKLYHYLPNIERFSRLKSSPLSSIHYKDYLKSVHPKIYRIKCPTYKSNFYLDYSNNIKKVSNNHSKLVKHYLDVAKYITRNIPIFKRYPWDIYMSVNGLEMDMPYTIHNSIIIPLKTLNELSHTFIHGHIDKNFVNILIHEQLHVIQRNNQYKLIFTKPIVIILISLLFSIIIFKLCIKSNTS